MRDSIYIYAKGKGFGEFFWNLCPACGNASVKIVFWEDGTVEHGDCLVCKRMSEIMELQELYERKTREEE